MKLKVFTAFSGYDSQCMALDRLGIDYELVGWSEIDKYAIMAHNAVYEPINNKYFRIRKLTAKECFRLMDVSDNDIEKIQKAGICKTEQYKMAGNSIVVSVLYYIFKNLFNL